MPRFFSPLGARAGSRERAGLVRHALAAAALVAAAASCSSDPTSPSGAGDDRESTGQTSQAIQGGTETKDYSFAVGICVGGPGVCRTLCSGALVTPNLVLTSRHCVDVAPDTAIHCASDAFGPQRGATDAFWVTTDETTDQTTRGWHQASRIITTPGSSFCGRDIAFIVLKDTVPATEATLVDPIVDSIADHAHYGTAVAAIGYGNTSPTAPDQGTRRVLQSIPIHCIPGDPSLDCSSSEGFDLTDKEFVSGSGVCFGDSGSSAYAQSELANGRARSLGVLSRGLEQGSTCAFGIYTRTDKWQGLLAYAADVASTAGSYTKPTWGNFQETSKFAPRALGYPCYEAAGCDSQVCGSLPDQKAFYCSQACNPQQSGSCPSGFRCLASTSGGFCFSESILPAPPPSNNCACSSGRAADGGAPLAGALAFVAAAVLRASRKRRQSS